MYDRFNLEYPDSAELKDIVKQNSEYFSENKMDRELEDVYHIVKNNN